MFEKENSDAAAFGVFAQICHDLGEGLLNIAVLCGYIQDGG
jgi:hypothetical protein